MENLPELIFPNELAERLGLSLQTTYNLIRSEGFPSIPLGKRYIIPRKAFEAWISDPDKITAYKANIVGLRLVENE